jgi:methionyl aminopeptidase
MINLKNDQEISIMGKGGLILTEVLNLLIKEAKSGVKLIELDKIAEDEIIKRGGKSSFKTVKDYRWTICTAVNDVVVHGIPNNYVLKNGDILGIDCGVLYNGFHTDCAWSVIVGDEKTLPSEIIAEGKSHEEKFLNSGRNALQKAIKKVIKGNYIYDISKTIQENIERDGFSVVRTLVGHGVGKQLHESPEVPGFVKMTRDKTPKIIPGMVLAVEVIYNLGGPDVVYKGNDGWTIATKDGTISGLFEATVAVMSHGSYVLTPIGSGETKI